MQCVAYTVHGRVRYTGERGVVCDPDPEGGGTPTKLAPKLSPNKLNMIERCDLTKIIVKFLFSLPKMRTIP